MSTQAEQIDLSQLTDEQLQKALKEREKKRKAEEQRKRREYENAKDRLTKDLYHQSIGLHESLSKFKQYAFEAMGHFYARMLEYGDLKEDNQGSFSIQSEDGTIMIKRDMHRNWYFDEKADLAEKHLQKFLQEFVKKRHLEVYDLITTALKRGKDGSLDPRSVHRLYEIEDRFEHEDWVKAIQLFKEAYKEGHTSKYILIKHRKNTDENWEAIQLNFSKIQI